MNARALPFRGVAAGSTPFGVPLIDPCNIVPDPCTLRPLDWARDVQRGKKVDLCPGQQETLVSLDNGHVQCGETIDVVLTSEICPDDALLDPDSLAWPHIVAHLCWGIGSTTFDAWIDIQTGTHFSIVAEMLRINVSYEILTPPWDPNLPPCLPTFRVKGGLGYGCSKRIQFTQLAFVEKPGGRCVLAIPPFAEALVVMVANGGQASVRVLPFGGALGVPVFSGSGASDLLPLMGGAESIEVVNTGTQPLAAFLVFVLGL